MTAGRPVANGALGYVGHEPGHGFDALPRLPILLPVTGRRAGSRPAAPAPV